MITTDKCYENVGSLWGYREIDRLGGADPYSNSKAACELVVQAPMMPDPFLAMEDGDRSPLGRRLLAAKAAGLVISAETVLTASQARTLAIAGFDRGGGPFAEAGLR